MLPISSFWSRISPNMSLSFPVMPLKLRARLRNSPPQRVETVTSKSPAATLDDASMTSRSGPVTDRVKKMARRRARSVTNPTIFNRSPRRDAMRASKSFMK